MNETQFSIEAEDMHAGAAERMTEAEKDALLMQEEERARMEAAEYGSRESRESAWAHAVLTGGE